MSLPSSHRRSKFLTGGVALVIVLVAGCGESRKSVFPVEGQVLDSEGKPAAGAKVIFHPLDDKDPKAVCPVGTVNDAGKFLLTTYVKSDGAPAGNYAVTIEWRPPPPQPFAPAPEDKLQGRFASVGKSPFKATIGKEPTTLEPFRLN